MKKVQIKKSLKLNKQIVTILNNHETAEIKGGITPVTAKPCVFTLAVHDATKFDTNRIDDLIIDTVK